MRDFGKERRGKEEAERERGDGHGEDHEGVKGDDGKVYVFFCLFDQF